MIITALFRSKLKVDSCFALAVVILVSCSRDSDSPFVGCSDSEAFNFEESAQIDDGSCIYQGCMDESACNYDPAVTIEDSSCEFETCIGCMDEAADNFDPLALIEGDCLYNCNGQFDHFGYAYELVAVGSQCWFSENLRTDKYDNGDSIPTVIDGWHNLDFGAKVPYGLGGGVDSGSENVEANFEDYGFLYNHLAIVDSRGLCPSGFHVPEMEEWNELKSYINDNSYLIRSSLDDDPPWNGDNVYGFSALPGGRRSGTSGGYYVLGTSCYFWSQSGTKVAIHTSQSPLFVNEPTSWYREGFSVRCLRD